MYLRFIESLFFVCVHQFNLSVKLSKKKMHYCFIDFDGKIKLYSLVLRGATQYSCSMFLIKHENKQMLSTNQLHLSCQSKV